MCRCRQPQRQASIIKISSTHTPAPRITSPTQSTSTSPTPTTPSPTPPPLQPVSFSYMKSFRDIQQQKHTPHYFYYQDSYSSSSSPPHEAATITAEALVHASCSLPSLNHISNISTSMQEIQGDSPASTLSRSLNMVSTLAPMIKQKTETVLEHCSCGLTFSVDHVLPTTPTIAESVFPEVPLVENNEEIFSVADSTYYETINEPVVKEHVHQHHSHHHGHIHYHMNAQQQTHNIPKEPPIQQYQSETTSQHQHYCHNCQQIPTIP